LGVKICGKNSTSAYPRSPPNGLLYETGGLLYEMAVEGYGCTNASIGTVLSIRPMRVSEAWRLTPV